MAKLSLQFGPLPFTSDGVYDNVPLGYKGVYALGYSDGTKGMKVLRIGRSDTCLNTRLLQYLQDTDYARCTHFFFEFTISVRRGYELECQLFHDYDPSLNFNHPGVPSGTNHACPVDGCED